MRINLTKVGEGALIPADQDAVDYIKKIDRNAVVSIDIKINRNYQFHKKYFCLLNFLYDHWQPAELQDPKWEGVTPEKSFEAFRKDIQILAGHYDAYYRIDGSVRIESKSIKFSKMSAESFEELYSAVIDAGLKHILNGYDNREQVDDVILELMGYT